MLRMRIFGDIVQLFFIPDTAVLNIFILRRADGKSSRRILSIRPRSPDIKPLSPMAMAIVLASRI
ncbi:hypothetical protein EGK14_16235 [Erwinia sp. 198]|nr:hypothetical protein EGK14_16235 [Erwinia sp. 198]